MEEDGGGGRGEPWRTSEKEAFWSEVKEIHRDLWRMVGYVGTGKGREERQEEDGEEGEELIRQTLTGLACVRMRRKDGGMRRDDAVDCIQLIRRFVSSRLAAYERLQCPGTDVLDWMLLNEVGLWGDPR